ncbi:hydroxysqualene dehydroxylase HpnE [Asaia krungthepensis]|uniref:Phytoene desaturase n=1 Tax=Asaia krungthepensis NRIC 0535 TaxID=1307925 RepID=A0ABQ0PW52_9PROT|nr:hydroxysqualene dehydroxylase HpnE [Asaia krungthepensis]GBQ83122.1 phytoene desaturase [Asaia krungthepensis NRIC 0535]
MTHVHIIGGGLAGLSAAVDVIGRAGVTIYEAGPACGGRARSYYDKALGARIDNGNHLLLSANKATFRYLGLIGAEKTLTGPGAPLFPWFDLSANLGWTLKLSKGRVPFWAFARNRRVPGMKLSELAMLGRILKAGPEDTVSEYLGDGMLSQRLLEPFAISALNTPVETASAALLGAIMRETLALGGTACCPWYPAEGLSESFVDPAIAHITRLQGEVRCGTRVSGVDVAQGRVRGLRIGNETIALGPEDKVVFAAPSQVARSVLEAHLPGFEAPDAYESIINVHYRLPGPVQARGMLGKVGFVGLVGGVAEWVYLKGEILSVTVSAANRYADRDNDELIAKIWSEIRQAVGPVLVETLPVAVPPVRLVCEKRATFAATPAQDRLRPQARTALENLALAGDWTQTGFPSTIEGAIRSGSEAIRALGL